MAITTTVRTEIITIPQDNMILSLMTATETQAFKPIMAAQQREPS